MPETQVEVLRRYLDDAVAAEKAFESQLRSFAAEGDDDDTQQYSMNDDEVQAAFAEQARLTAAQIVRLTARLEQFGGTPSMAKSLLGKFFGFAPKTAQLTHREEERLTQNLMMAYTVEMSQVALYEALAVTARLALDEQTAQLAHDISLEEREAAIVFWRFIPSRSKIAFNMLTAGEVDPSVDTKAPGDPFF